LVQDIFLLLTSVIFQSAILYHMSLTVHAYTRRALDDRQLLGGRISLLVFGDVPGGYALIWQFLAINISVNIAKIVKWRIFRFNSLYLSMNGVIVVYLILNNSYIYI